MKLTPRRAVAAFVMIAVAAALFVPAAGAAVPPAKWGKTFCTSMSRWANEVQTAGTAMMNLSGKDEEQIRDDLVGFLDEATTSSKQAARTMKRAGAPDTPRGKKIARRVVRFYKDAAATFEKAARRIERAPLSDPAQFQAVISDVVADIQGMDTGEAFEDIGRLDRGNKLGKKLAKVRACRSLGT